MPVLLAILLLLYLHAQCAVRTGLIGTAPSQELLDIWNKREAELVEAGPEGTTLGGVLHTRPLGELRRDSSLSRVYHQSCTVLLSVPDPPA